MQREEATNPKGELQERIFRTIYSFPKRLDEMETRSEENCRVLAFQISEIVERELRRRSGR